MPKRSNDFQAVVYFVRSHVDAQAAVIESALLPDRTGAGLREVDVLITSRVQGREFRIGVECRDHRRASDIVWVEQARTKQADLELDQMVLVSSSGFTGGAVAKAGYHGIELVTPDRPIPADGPLGRLGQPSLEFRDVTRDRLVSVSGRICLNGRLQSVPLTTGTAVFDAQGAQVSSTVQLVADSLDRADLRQVVAQAAGQSGDFRVEMDHLVLRPAD
ncbi:restriction endonuclease [Actinomadura geliboluensis]|uniref:restriction endonuclease n=1 Tax=Actinomadura geliboluensis TaxID=882440 RepID=UPI001486F0A3|nr:restriction endonuclease [Actinomadura geliboluensis]